MKPIAILIALAGAATALATASAQQLDLTPETRAALTTGTTATRADQAMSNYMDQGDDGATLLELARAGHRDAARIIGRKCLRDDICPSTRAEAHDLLVEAAKSDPSSATTLGAIYRDGAWGGAPQMIEAAQWIGYAYDNGLESAQYMLETLPREAVRAAGKEQILLNLEARDRARALSGQAGDTPEYPVAPPQGVDTSRGSILSYNDEHRAEKVADLLSGTGN